MAPILLYHAFKATTPFVDAFVNERVRQLLWMLHTQNH